MIYNVAEAARRYPMGRPMKVNTTRVAATDMACANSPMKVNTKANGATV